MGHPLICTVAANEKADEAADITEGGMEGGREEGMTSTKWPRGFYQKKQPNVGRPLGL